MSGGKNETTTQTDQSVTDQRTGAEGDGVAVGAGASYSVTTIDPGAIGLGVDALGLAETVAGRLIEFADRAGQRGDAIAKGAAAGDSGATLSTMKFLGAAALATAAVVMMGR
jgi:hypothetical protein